jgi:hypothetical protein
MEHGIEAIEYDDLGQLQRIISDVNWGTYYIGKYYFSINTQTTKAALGIDTVADMPTEVQRRLQWKNFAALLHEYIHYIHEISTVIGNLGLAMDIVSKSMFSHYFDQDLTSSKHLGLVTSGRAVLSEYGKNYSSGQVILGSDQRAIEGTFMRVKAINYKQQDLHIRVGNGFQTIPIDVPLLTFEQAINNQYLHNQLYFGKYFIYEGLAYELDRIAERHLHPNKKIDDYAKGSEYTVLRALSQFLYPGIEKEDYLTIASLSLSYLDCGAMFIDQIKHYKSEIEKGATRRDVLKEMKDKVSGILFKKLEVFNEAQDEIVNVFNKRPRLKTAFSGVATAAKNAYLARCERPAFEVELIIAGDFNTLLSVIPMCDLLYVFQDRDPFMRDFLGSPGSDPDLSDALKALIAYDHYQKTHQLASTEKVEEESHPCPFFTCCGLQLRKDHAALCGHRPWRIFEISTKTDHQYCWYGTGVAEFKGHTER